MEKSILLIGLACLILCPTLLYAQDAPVLAVLDFQVSGISKAEARILVDYISSHVVESGKYVVIDRMERESLLEEIEFSYSDCVDERCQIELGRQLAANQIIVGSVGQIGERYLLNIKLIQVETGATINSVSGKYTSIEELIDSSRNLTFVLISGQARTIKAGPVFEEQAVDQTLIPEGFVLVEAGTFRMGSLDGDDDEKPVHQVSISWSFYMSQFEVTQKQWQELMGANPSRFTGADRPVERVSFHDAIDYCNLLSKKERLTPCYSRIGSGVRCDFSANGYRLPTEAEWEFAASGGNSSISFDYAGNDSANEVGWYLANSGARTHEIGLKKPNELGLYDLSGNVWEWCWDWKDDYSSSYQKDPTGPSSRTYRVVRGGGWRSPMKYLTISCRNGLSPSGSMNDVGFRPVRTAE